VEALKQMQMMRTSLPPSDANQFHVNFTTLAMSSQESCTHLLRPFGTSKRHAEEAGLAYTEEFTVDLLLSIINKSNKS
jgi:hypothetical protein